MAVPLTLSKQQGCHKHFFFLLISTAHMTCGQKDWSVSCTLRTANPRDGKSGTVQRLTAYDIPVSCRGHTARNHKLYFITEISLITDNSLLLRDMTIGILLFSWTDYHFSSLLPLEHQTGRILPKDRKHSPNHSASHSASKNNWNTHLQQKL